MYTPNESPGTSYPVSRFPGSVTATASNGNGTPGHSANGSVEHGQPVYNEFLSRPGPLNMSRKNSGASMASFASVQSVPHTPLGQVPPPASYTMHRFGSISSVCTTDDEDGLESSYKWMPEHDRLLIEQYEQYVDDPTTAPFSGRFPPSGVIQRVAKNTLKAAQHSRVSFPHTASSVRRRLLILASRDQSEQDTQALGQLPQGQVVPTTGLGRSGSVDYFGTSFGASFGSNLGQLNGQSNLGPGVQFDAEAEALLTEADALDALDAADQDAHPPAARHLTPPQYDSELASERLDEFNFDETPRPNRTWRHGIVPTVPAPLQLNPDAQASLGGVPLASPFRESFALQANAANGGSNNGSVAGDDESEDDILNIVAKRKRDSLRMKRGGR